MKRETIIKEAREFAASANECHSMSGKGMSFVEFLAEECRSTEASEQAKYLLLGDGDIAMGGLSEEEAREFLIEFWNCIKLEYSAEIDKEMNKILIGK
ncbi:MAG: hypothetical protein SPI35_05860 [Porphyromonas sp.]|nr:hypothetical protein [Porphyromonas sp.]